MAISLITQNKVESAAAVSSFGMTLNVSSDSAEKAMLVYISSGVVTSVTVNGVAASLVGSSSKWYQLAGISNGSNFVVINLNTSTANVRVWAGAFADVYQTSPFVSLQSGGIACTSGTSGSWDFVYSTATPSNDSLPSVGYRTLKGIFEFASTDNLYSSSSPGCAGVGYYNNTPYSAQTTYTNATGTYAKIMFVNSVIPATADNRTGANFAGRDFEYGVNSTFSEFVWAVTGNNTFNIVGQTLII